MKELTTLDVLENIRGKMWPADGQPQPDLTLARRVIDDAIEREKFDTSGLGRPTVWQTDAGRLRPWL